MNSKHFSIDTVEGVLKSSKQLQNKIRKELSLQVIETPVAAEFKNPEQLPPVWDNAMLGPYVDNIVADYIQNKSKQINKVIKTPREAAGVKANNKKLSQNSSNGINVRDSFLSFHRNSISVGNQVGEKSTTKSTSRVRVPNKRLTTSTLNEAAIDASKNNFETNKLVSTSSNRLPLQRFAESTNKKIDFFEEHPNLELDMTSKQMTLFPRRFYRSIKTECLPENEECVNVVEAEVKPPQKGPVEIMQDTWNGILMQNKPKSKLAHKMVQLKTTKEVINDGSLKCLHVAPREQIEEPDKSNDIITLIPSKGIFTLQKQSERLAKQKKCNFQRFPVLYIRPECQIQKVANISICGEIESILKARIGNVKYLECKHGDKGGDGVKTFDQEFILDRVGIDLKEKNVINEAKTIKENKFCKALDFINLYEYSTTNSASSPLTHQSSSFSRSFSSLSSSSSLKRVNPSTTGKEFQHNLRSPSKRILSTRITNNSVKMCKHVQTENEYKETVSTNISPLQYPTKSSPQLDVTTSTKNNDTLNKIARPHEAENSIEDDDIIAKIFERIRKDLPDALEVYKNRNISSEIGVTTILPISCSEEKQEREQEQEQTDQKHLNQKRDSNDEPNVKLLPNLVEPLLPRVQDKGQGQDNHNQAISQMILIGSYKDSSPPSIPETHKEVLMQQNPFYVQTINEIDSSIVHDVIDVERIKQKRYEYPTDTEIKRAVKMFINSLTLDGCGSEKKTIINDVNTKKKSKTLPKSQLISSNRHNKYTSSNSSNISNSLIRINKMATNFKRTRNTVRWCDVSGSCTSSSLSSTDIESESDVTNDMENLSKHTNTISDGEIKSIGEI